MIAGFAACVFFVSLPDAICELVRLSTVYGFLGKLLGQTAAAGLASTALTEEPHALGESSSGKVAANQAPAFDLVTSHSSLQVSKFWVS